MADVNNFNTSFFSLNRLKFSEMWSDALTYMKSVYQSNDEEFNSASPFGQLMAVLINIARMIFYYIEDSITGLNIRTAWRLDQIRGLATLTGHNPGRAVASRCSVKLTYNGSNSDYDGQIIYIPNKLKVTNILNGMEYILMVGANTIKMTLEGGNYVNANLIQGKVTYQQATSDGTILQSFNFAEKNYATVDQYYVYVYVNGVAWKVVENFLDMGYQEEAVVVRTGFTGGLDVFFGNGTNGQVPAEGATIMIEYIVTAGLSGNFDKDEVNTANYWNFDDKAYLADGSEVDLTTLMYMECTTSSMFGAYMENPELTKRLAPYASTSMVLANATNYKYYLEKLKLFSVVDVISGYNSISDKQAKTLYEAALYKYTDLKTQYENAVNLYGNGSDVVTQLNTSLQQASKNLSTATKLMENAKLDDNTVYFFLIPDYQNRISSGETYFTCDVDKVFKLTSEEKYNIINLLDMSGQSSIATEHKILTGYYPKFAVNIAVRAWEGYEYDSIYSAIISNLSVYFMTFSRRDRVPVSDIISVCENIAGIDSVTIYFDADPANEKIYKKSGYYGIDSYGDITLERQITNNLGEEITIRDIFPLFRGGFTNADGIEYSDEQSSTILSAVNVTIVGYSSTKLDINVENKLFEA